MKQKLKYQIALHIIIFIWGFTAILGKWIEANAFVLVWYRVLIAFASLFVFLLLLKRNWRILNKKDLYRTLGVGVLVALHWLTFYLSIKLSTASLAIVCLATTTIHVAWLEPIVMKRRALKSEFIISMVIIAGIILITNQGSQEGLFLGILLDLLHPS